MNKIIIKFTIFMLMMGVSTPSMSNLVLNGDFSAGNSGFNSDYTFVTTNTTAGEYGIGIDPNLWASVFDSFGDHTTGTGNMMFVNGASIANQVVWTQNVSVTPNTLYDFSGWVSSLLSYPNPAVLQLFVNGSQVGANITASTVGGVWEQFSGQWDSGTSSLASLAIYDINLAFAPNDFALDDLSFTVVPIPAAGWLFASGVAGLAVLVRRRRKALI